VDLLTSNDSLVATPPAQTGVISSRVWRETASAERPRLLCVQPHQRINFTLVDFSVDEPTTSIGRVKVGGQSLSTTCSDPLIAVRDDVDGVDNGTVVCGGQRRLSSVYLSSSSCVHVSLNATTARSAEFLIYYEGMQYRSIDYCSRRLAVCLYETANSVPVTLITRKLCYRKDDRAMRAI